MKNIRKIASYALVGGFGLIMAGGLSGCSREDQSEISVQQGAFVILEETAPGKYKVLEEFPSNETRIVVKGLDGTERVLSKEEADALIAQENAKIDAGTSNLTNGQAQISSGGMGLGEAILASAAGAIIGSWIGNKLFSNPSYQNTRQSAYKNPSTYTRSVDSFNKAKTAQKQSSRKSGFFGGGSKNSGSTFGG